MQLWQVVQNVRCNSAIILLAMVGGEQMLWTSVKIRFTLCVHIYLYVFTSVYGTSVHLYAERH